LDTEPLLQSIWSVASAYTHPLCPSLTHKLAAMPSLHFGYSLLIGLTIMSIPLSPSHRRGKSLSLPLFNQSHPTLAPRIHLPSRRRLLCIIFGFLYPSLILIAIISTANHFILDAVAGAVVCAFGWWGNAVLLNLLPVEDYFLYALRIHKPVQKLQQTQETQIGPDHESKDGPRASILLE
jgi:PAP2 superfamily